MKKVDKIAIDKKAEMLKEKEHVVAPRLKGKVKNAKLRTRKATDKQVRKPRKRSK